MIGTSYHNHTQWSDGSATVQEMIDAARAAGLTECGFSDHFALSPQDPVTWALAPERLADYVAEIENARRSTQDIIIRIGLEVDYFPQTIEKVRQLLAPYSFDYLIGSVHFVDGFPVDFSAQPWEKISAESRNNVWNAYWKLLGEAVQTGIFDIIGHFDLPKKFKFLPSIDLTEQALSVLDAMAGAGTVLEINTSGWDRPVCEAYPEPFYLREAKRRDIALVINSDAHAATEITRHFERARELAGAAGYTHVTRFAGRRRSLIPL